MPRRRRPTAGQARRSAHGRPRLGLPWTVRPAAPARGAATPFRGPFSAVPHPSRQVGTAPAARRRPARRTAATPRPQRVRAADPIRRPRRSSPARHRPALRRNPAAAAPLSPSAAAPARHRPPAARTARAPDPARGAAQRRRRRVPRSQPPTYKDHDPVVELALTEIAGHLTFTQTMVTAWYWLPEVRWAFRPDADREALIIAISEQYAGLAGFRLHLRRTTRAVRRRRVGPHASTRTPRARCPT